MLALRASQPLRHDRLDLKTLRNVAELFQSVNALRFGPWVWACASSFRVEMILQNVAVVVGGFPGFRDEGRKHQFLRSAACRS